MDSSFNVLIYCHRREVKYNGGRVEGHWQGDIIGNGIRKMCNGQEVVIDTVDIIPGGTYTADAFSEYFITDHIEEYDLIALPDCGGPWVETVHAQEDYKGMDYNIRLDILTQIVVRIMDMLKFGGKIMLGKYTSEEWRDSLAVNLAAYYDVEMKNFNSSYGIDLDYIVVTKNN